MSVLESILPDEFQTTPDLGHNFYIVPTKTASFEIQSSRWSGGGSQSWGKEADRPLKGLERVLPDKFQTSSKNHVHTARALDPTPVCWAGGWQEPALQTWADGVITCAGVEEKMRRKCFRNSRECVFLLWFESFGCGSAVSFLSRFGRLGRLLTPAASASLDDEAEVLARRRRVLPTQQAKQGPFQR